MGLVAVIAVLGMAAVPSAAVTPEPAGGAVAAATQNAPVTVTAPTPYQQPHHVVLPYSEHVTWLVDGVTQPPEVEGDVILYGVAEDTWPAIINVIAQPKPGVTITGQDLWTFSFSAPEPDPEPEIIQVEATEPVINDVDGVDADTITIPNIEGVQYFVNDVPYTAGTHPVPHPEDPMDRMTTTLHVVARALDGYALQNWWTQDDWYLYVDALKTADTPVKPVIHDQPGFVDDTFTAPYVEGVDYELHVYQSLPNESIDSWGYTLIEPGETYNPSVIFPLLADKPVVLGFSVYPQPGYRLPDELWGEVYEWRTTTYTPEGWDDSEDEKVVVDIPEIEVIDAGGVDGDKLIFPDAEGVSYLIFVFDGLDGGGIPDHSEYVTGEVSAHEFASFPQPDSYQVLVKVIADEGYVFPDERPSVDVDFEFSTLNDGEPAPTVVELPEVYKTEIDGQEGYLLPQFSGGFTWYVNGETIDHWINEGKARFVPAPGTGMSVSATGGLYEITADGMGVDIDEIVIAAVAEDGYVLATADGDPVDTVVVADARTGVELGSPTVVDAFGTEDDAFTIPDVPGLVFTDEDGNVLEPGDHPVTAEYVDGEATVILTASAADGYRLEVDGQAVETTPGGTGSHTLTLTFTDATAPVDDEDDTEPGDDTPGPGESDEDTEEPGQGDEEETDEPGESDADQTGDDDTTEDPGVDLDIELGADQDDDGTDAGDSDETDDDKSVKQDNSKQDDAAEVESLAASGAGGTLAAVLVAMALLMAGVTLAIARRTTQVR